jgi:hypothetical protein
VTSSLRALVAGVIDYAGLFPPAGLDMAAAVDNYSRYREGGHAWMLGRFVVPVSRLGEFVDAATSGLDEVQPWPISAIVGADLSGDLSRVADFNSGNHGAMVDTVEVKAGDDATIAAAAEALPAGVRAFVEISETAIKAVAAVGGSRMGAKIRTGGVTADAFPTVDDVARFVRRCYASNVTFKATAGLHHPVRGRYRLTYEDGAAVGVMHGFLNVLLGAVFCFNGLGVADAPRLLSLESAAAWSFGDDGVEWEDYRVSTAEIEKIRRRFFVSFGSCSFQEPVDDLRRLGLLD